MGGNTGNLITRRNQSAVNGSKTLGSILASDSINGAGSVRRVYGWYKRHSTVDNFYKGVFDINYGQFRDRAQFFLGSIA
jgi:hypothetical protein